MGDYRVVIEAIGGHGCDREAKEGEELKPCGSESCPDCACRDFVSRLKKNSSISLATLTHWPTHLDHRVSGYQAGPGSPVDIVDDLVAGKRIKGAFK